MLTNIKVCEFHLHNHTAAFPSDISSSLCADYLHEHMHSMQLCPHSFIKRYDITSIPIQRSSQRYQFYLETHYNTKSDTRNLKDEIVKFERFLITNSKELRVYVMVLQGVGVRKLCWTSKFEHCL